MQYLAFVARVSWEKPLHVEHDRIHTPALNVEVVQAIECLLTEKKKPSTVSALDKVRVPDGQDTPTLPQRRYCKASSLTGGNARQGACARWARHAHVTHV